MQIKIKPMQSKYLKEAIVLENLMKGSFMTTLAQAVKRLRILLEENNQELFDADKQRRMLIPTKALVRIEDLI